MSDKLAIQAVGLKKSYGSMRALQGVDLEVGRGEIFGFLGPNGAGKTTTIRCMLDLIRPDGGVLRVLGLDPQKNPVEVCSRVGYLPGELHIDGNFTVEGALKYLNNLRGGRGSIDFTHSLAERIDLDLKMQVRNLSKGNKQKVGVVQALMHRPELLLLDEPTFGLDPLVQQEVLHMVEEARQQGATVFFSSHILSEVEAIAERVAIIRLGKVVEVANIEALLNRSLRRVRVRFRGEVPEHHLADLPGVSLISEDDGHGVLLQVEGEMDALIKNLAAFPVSIFETERATLEEIFLAYYEKDKVEIQDSVIGGAA